MRQRVLAISAVACASGLMVMAVAWLSPGLGTGVALVAGLFGSLAPLLVLVLGGGLLERLRALEEISAAKAGSDEVEGLEAALQAARREAAEAVSQARQARERAAALERIDRKRAELIEGQARLLEAALARIAEGDFRPAAPSRAFDEETRALGDRFARLHAVLGRARYAVAGFGADVELLAGSLAQGRLGARVDLDRHSGEYRRHLEALHRGLDASLEPIDAAVEALSRAAELDLAGRVDRRSSGEHARLVDAVNSAIVRVGMHLAESSASAEELMQQARRVEEGEERAAAGLSEGSVAAKEIAERLGTLAARIERALVAARELRSGARQSVATAGEGAGELARIEAALEAVRQESGRIDGLARDLQQLGWDARTLAELASVESVRAGVEGHGLRSLSDRAQEIAARIAELSGGMEARARQSAERAHEAQLAGDALGAVVASLSRSAQAGAGLAGDLLEAGREGLAAARQVHGEAEELGRAIQQSRDAAGSSSEASGRIAEKARGFAAAIRHLGFQPLVLASAPAQSPGPEVPLASEGDDEGAPRARGRKRRNALRLH